LGFGKKWEKKYIERVKADSNDSCESKDVDKDDVDKAKSNGKSKDSDSDNSHTETYSDDSSELSNSEASIDNVYDNEANENDKK